MLKRQQPKESAQISFGDFDHLANAIAEIGTKSFYPALLDAISGMASWQACAVARYSSYSGPEHIFYDGLETQMLELYQRGYYRTDPIYRLVHEGIDTGVYSYSRDFPASQDSSFSLVYLPMAGWADITCMLLPSIGRTVTGLFWLSQRKTFPVSLLTKLKIIYPVVRAMHEQHTLSLVRSFSEHGANAAKDKAYALIDLHGKTVFATPTWASQAGMLKRAVSGAQKDKHLTYTFPDGSIVHLEQLPRGFGPAPNPDYSPEPRF